jgi:thioredoxin reductase
MNLFDVLIIGGGVSGMQCALILGSSKEKLFAKDKNIGIIFHQKTSHLHSALFNNVLGIETGTLGETILKKGKNQLTSSYPNVTQREGEKVLAVKDLGNRFKITTNKNEYHSHIVVIALNYAKPFSIDGLDVYVEPHARANPKKNRIQLKNSNHLIKKGLYACGTIAGWRSQFAIAAGSGASVATDILTLWNDNTPTKIHDKK